MASLLKIENLEKYYGSRGNITRALNRVSFEAERGEFLGIMGASGSGKTTLLNTVATIHRCTAGHIYLGETDITKLKNDELARFRMEHLGFVFQDFNLLDNFTLEENIGLALTLRGTPRNEVKKLVFASAEKLGISEILQKMPSEVSGGQRQRCACARAIINQPDLLLADEPTGALDSHSAQQLLECFERLNASLQTTILMVTHDVFSASYCSRILFLKDGAIFSEIRRGGRERRKFFQDILDTVTLMGGDVSNAR